MRTFVGSGGLALIDIQIEITGPGDFDPFTSASNANLIYDYVICNAVDRIGDFSPLTGNQKYGVDVTYSSIDFPGSNRELPYLTIFFDIYRYEN